MTEDETNLITSKSKWSLFLLFLLPRLFAELIQLPIPAKIFQFSWLCSSVSWMAQQGVWQHNAGEEEGTAYLEEVVGRGGTSFCQGHRAFRSAVVIMEYFILWDLQENDKITLFPCSMEYSHSKKVTWLNEGRKEHWKYYRDISFAIIYFQ